jgi:hypothetical protein
MGALIHDQKPCRRGRSDDRPCGLRVAQEGTPRHRQYHRHHPRLDLSPYLQQGPSPYFSRGRLLTFRRMRLLRHPTSIGLPPAPTPSIMRRQPASTAVVTRKRSGQACPPRSTTQREKAVALGAQSSLGRQQGRRPDEIDAVGVWQLLFIDCGPLRGAVCHLSFAGERACPGRSSLGAGRIRQDAVWPAAADERRIGTGAPNKTTS